MNNGGKYELAREIAALRFAVIELQLYLDTHPDSAEALSQFSAKQNAYNAKLREYTEKYGPINAFDMDVSNGYEWFEDSTPWEGDALCGNT